MVGSDVFPIQTVPFLADEFVGFRGCTPENEHGGPQNDGPWKRGKSL